MTGASGSWFPTRSCMGSGKHWGDQCSTGYHSFRSYGRNLRVASVDPYRQYWFLRKAKGDLNKTIEKCKKNVIGLRVCESHDAKTILNIIPARWTDSNSCYSRAAVGVIYEPDGLYFIASPGRSAHVRTRDFLLYIFG